MNHIDDVIARVPDDPVCLPPKVADALGVKANSRARHVMTRSVRIIESLDFDRAPQDEVIYELFLDPFHGQPGKLGQIVDLYWTCAFLASQLDVSTFLVIPLFQRGTARTKGRDGSPFAVRSTDFSDEYDKFREVSGETLWSTLVSACRRQGIRLGFVAPLATVAIDSPDIARFPSAFYWWARSPETRLMGTEVSGPSGNPYSRAAVPVLNAVGDFRRAPDPLNIRQVRSGSGGHLHVATSDTDGRELSVPNAYPDPVAGDASTYTWEDVTPIRYRSELFPVAYEAGASAALNGAALEYGALRMSGFLARGEAVMQVDVSTAIPRSVVQPAVDQDVLLVAEELWSFERRDPYQVVVGPFIPCVAAMWRDPKVMLKSLAYHLDLLSHSSDLSPWLAGTGNHDTDPPPPSTARILRMISACLPGSVLFLYSGAETFCQVPTNLEFSIVKERSGNENLLFNKIPVERDWELFAVFEADWRLIRGIRADLGAALSQPRAVVLSDVRLGSASLRWSIRDFEFDVAVADGQLRCKVHKSGAVVWECVDDGP